MRDRMGLDLAKEQVYLERTKLRYVSLSNILNDARFDRRGRVDGVVGVVLGQTCYWIFMREGEAVNALRREPGKPARPVPIGEVLRIAERGDDHGQAFYYGMPEGQLRAMFAAAGPALELEAVDVSDPLRFFAQMRELRVDGVLELETPEALHYLVLREGEVSEAYLGALPAGRSRGEYLRSLLEGDGWAQCQVHVYSPVEDLPVQAGPSIVRLYGGLMESTLARLAEEIGEARAREAVETALAQAAVEHPSLKAFEVSRGRVEGEPVATADALTAAIAQWFLGTLSRAERFGLASPADVAEVVTAPIRMALNELGFLGRLPWPVSL